MHYHQNEGGLNISRLLGVIVLLLLLFSVTSSVVSAMPDDSSKNNLSAKAKSTATTIFETDFENSGVGTTPPEFYIKYNGRGDQYQVVTSDAAHSGIKSIQAWGQPNWGANIYYPIANMPEKGRIGFEVWVKANPKDEGWAQFVSTTGSTWGWGWGGVSFDSEGYINAPATAPSIFRILQSAGDKWCKVRSEMDVETGACWVWIDDNLVVNGVTPAEVGRDSPDAFKTIDVVGIGDSSWYENPSTPTYFDDFRFYTRLPDERDERFETIEGYENLLRSQTVLIGSLESLLKNSTLNGTTENYGYQFLDSFDDLADRQQKGLYSFEDAVSFNWSTLTDEQKIALTASFEDLLRREAIILDSNEDLLKRGFCDLSDDEKEDLLERFESRLKYEVVLYEKFEDWLHFQQMMEDEEYETWIGFLSSFEDLIRRQSNLLDSFEMLMKIRCDETYLALNKTAVQEGNNVTYTYNVTAGTNDLQNVTIEDSILGTIEEDFSLAAGDSEIVAVGPFTLQCADCDNCTCRVCNFATACAEVITPNGNFTACVVSDQVCATVDETSDTNPIYPG